MASTTRELALLLTAKNLASKALKDVKRDVHGLGTAGVVSGKGLGIMGKAAIGVGAAVATGLGVAVKQGLESLAVRQQVVSETANAIEATGNKAGVSAPKIRQWAEELEAATGAAVDDKAIQAGMNTLIRSGAVSEGMFKRTAAAAVDMGAAMKTGPEAASKTLARAMADPIKGMAQLRRANVVLTAAEQARIKGLVDGGKPQEAQLALLEALERRYKGAAAASQGPYARSLSLLSDAAEDAKMALGEGFLPVIERAATMLNRELAKPETISRIREFGQGMADAFDKAITFAERVPWSQIGQGLAVAADWAGKLVGAFASLPAEAQGILLGLAGLTKLTGGAPIKIAVDLAQGLLGQFFGRGSSPAAPMYTKEVGLGGGLGSAVGGGLGKGKA
jgi:hypothetical protein